jgi:sugar/nucleoside kinase (ribokinase family)
VRIAFAPRRERSTSGRYAVTDLQIRVGFTVPSAEVDLLVLGGLGVDIAVPVPVLPLPFADSLLATVELRIGNTGSGVALAAAALGLRVAVIDTLGDDACGLVVRAALDRSGIETILLPDPRGTRRSVNLIDPGGRRMSLHDPRTPWVGPPPLSPGALMTSVERTQRVHVSIMDWIVDLLPVLVECDRPLSTDLHDWDGVAAYHRPFAEAADLVFVSGAGLPDVDRGLATILDHGRATRAIATLGADGARLSSRATSPLHVPSAPPPAPVVDTNGAGDAFVAGFLAGQLRGWSDADSARYAATVAAAACTHHGMEYPVGLLPRP